jgi:hypothetical protein
MSQKTKATQERKTKTLKVAIPPINEMPEEVYVNNMWINHTGHEFTLVFGKLTTPIELQAVEDGAEVPLEVKARICIAPSLMRAIIRALQTNLENYEKSYGPVQDRELGVVK